MSLQTLIPEDKNRRKIRAQAIPNKERPKEKKDKEKDKKKEKRTAKKSDKKKKKALGPKKDKFDLFTLYEKSVMSPDADVDFMLRSFKKIRNRKPKLFREDFCQTALLACEWAKRKTEHQAWGIDLNPVSLDWARKFNFPVMGEAASRVHLLEENVLHAKTPKMDVICALNFSYLIFKKRQELLAYFQTVFRDLKKDGVFYLDILGGPEIQEPVEDKTKHGYFTYIWEQAEFNPINHDFLCHIHFKLKKGKMIKKAFTYDWRLWSVPEIRDILEQAGFSEIRVYWEDEDEDGDGNGTFRQRKNAENSDAWVSYIVAVK